MLSDNDNSAPPQLAIPGSLTSNNYFQVRLVACTHRLILLLFIATMPGTNTLDFATSIHDAVHALKVDRDTWQTIALKYKAAFEAQTNRLQELQGVCFATQAELENARIQHDRMQDGEKESQRGHCGPFDGALDARAPHPFGTAVIFPHRTSECNRRASDECNNALFYRVHDCIDQRNYGSAICEIDRLLRGPLSPKARAEGLLLKSDILRAAGPDELYDALAACSEAIELCDRIDELQSFLPKVQYQRGVLFYNLRMLHQARDAFSAASGSDRFSSIAKEYRRSCESEIEFQRAANRRTGFDENRAFDEDLVVQLDRKLDVIFQNRTSWEFAKAMQEQRRRTSAQLRLRAVTKAKRMSLPRRWVSASKTIAL